MAEHAECANAARQDGRENRIAAYMRVARGLGMPVAAATLSAAIVLSVATAHMTGDAARRDSATDQARQVIVVREVEPAKALAAPVITHGGSSIPPAKPLSTSAADVDNARLQSQLQATELRVQALARDVRALERLAKNAAAYGERLRVVLGEVDKLVSSPAVLEKTAKRQRAAVAGQ